MKRLTVKIRLGWDENSINCVEVAKVIEESGASAITIHARTRSEGYSGHARWEYIKMVKEAVSIPVIGNGDVTNAYEAEKMLKETGCDAVMIGRASLGNPWIFKDCIDLIDNHKEPVKRTIEEIINMIKTHYELLKKDKNEKVALLEIRSNILFYLKGLPHSKDAKNIISSCQSEEELIKALDDYYNNIKEEKEEQ